MSPQATIIDPHCTVNRRTFSSKDPQNSFDPTQRQQPLSPSSGTSVARPDPLARRPNQKCDPYEQGGKPLSLEESQRLFRVHGIDEWNLLETTRKGQQNDDKPSLSLVREFPCKNFIEASKLASRVAAVAFVENHYPIIQLERRLLAKSWQVYVTVSCHTATLGGLSYNDFYLAMMIDVCAKEYYDKENTDNGGE